MKVTKQITPEEFRRLLGKRIKELREMRGSNQVTFTAAIGWPQSRLSRIETGQADVTVFRLRQLAEALGTTITKLLEPLI
jgi:transcriptional regulator with XRE-family HTH domain